MNRKRRVSTRKKKAILSAVAAGVWFSGLFLVQRLVPAANGRGGGSGYDWLGRQSGF